MFCTCEALSLNARNTGTHSKNKIYKVNKNCVDQDFLFLIWSIHLWKREDAKKVQIVHPVELQIYSCLTCFNSIALFNTTKLTISQSGAGVHLQNESFTCVRPWLQYPTSKKQNKTKHLKNQTSGPQRQHRGKAFGHWF